LSVGRRHPPLRAGATGVEKLILTVVRQNGLTCVMVSHDLAQAARVADRVMVMSKGRIEKIGMAGEVINAEGTFR
jgi:ABC-type sulfate/molybdate transport systems ATPase subunit